MSMMLRLYITGDWPAQTTACDWALYDQKGSLMQRGSSEPRHWPAAEECELVLSAEQCLTLEAKLPAGVKGAARSGDLIAYAIEDQLVGEVEHEHFVAGETRSDGRTQVWVIAKARLRSLLAALQQLSRVPSRAFSELQLLPLASGCWSVCLGELGGFVRTGSETGFAFDCDPGNRAPPIALRLALAAAKKTGKAPEAIDAYCVPGVELDAGTWKAELGTSARKAGEYVWQNFSARTARNLLTGEFAPKRERGTVWSAFRPAASFAALLLAVYALFSIGEWIWLDQQAGRLRARTVEIFRAAFPQVQNVVDPSLQMQRLYDQAKRERGQLGESDFLPLLAAVSETVGGQGVYRSLSFEEGRLEFAITLPNATAAERLRDALSKRGLSPTLRESRMSGTGLETSFSVRRGS